MEEEMSTVTPEEITNQLNAMGINENGEIRKEVQDSKAEESKEEKPVTEKKDEEVRVLSKIEKEAFSKGWTPDGPKSAEEFLRAEPLYDELKLRGKEIKELKATLDELKVHMTKQQEIGYKQAIAELELAKNDAIKRGDIAGVEAADKKIAEQQEDIREQELKPEDPKVVEFKERHADWIADPSYESQLIRDFAQKRDQELVQYGLSPDEHLQILEKDLRLKFPDRFQVEERTAPRQTVESNAGAAVNKVQNKKFGFSDLNSEQKTCARHFEKRGVMKVNDYINQLVESGDLK